MYLIKCIFFNFRVVFTGPLYLPNYYENNKKYVKYEVIGDPPIAVPTHFFKVIMCELYKSPNSVERIVASFIIPNQPISINTPLNTFAVPLIKVEEASGLKFFTRLVQSRQLDPYKISTNSQLTLPGACKK